MTAAPKLVFIVPYRDRAEQCYFFVNHMVHGIAPGGDGGYEIYFAHQCDSRTFNRGATKNIGFLAVKDKYPEEYRDITFVFNDVDTLAFADVFDYATTAGVVKHFYGFKHSLGGIVSVTGADFERTNGFPCLWGWGMEDNAFQSRCVAAGLTIDRAQWCPIGHRSVLHLFDGVSRLINDKDPYRGARDNGLDGIKTIHKLRFCVSRDSTVEVDNARRRGKPALHGETSVVWFVNIATFMTGTRFEADDYYEYDLRDKHRRILRPSQVPPQRASSSPGSGAGSGSASIDDWSASPHAKRARSGPDDWTRIPFFPTAERQQDMVRRYGSLQAAHDVIRYSHAHGSDPFRELRPPGPAAGGVGVSAQQKYSAAYAQQVGARPRAQASANIGLGGVSGIGGRRRR
jgi:hypothetical protein